MRKNKIKKIIFIILSFQLIISCSGGKNDESVKTEKNQEAKNESFLNEANKIETSGNSQNQVNKKGNKEKFGNEEVGYIDFPEGWKEIDDTKTSITSKVIEKDYQSIRLDIIDNNKGKNLEQLRDSMAEEARNLYKTSIIEKKEATINSYPAKQILIKMPDDTVILMSLLNVNEKFYYIEIIGNEEEVKENFEFINNSWNNQKQISG